MEKKENNKVAAVVLDGKEYIIQDMPVGLIDTVAKNNNVSWIEVVASPVADLAVATELLHAVAAHNKTTVPGELTIKTIVDFYRLVDDDVEETETEVDDNPKG